MFLRCLSPVNHRARTSPNSSIANRLIANKGTHRLELRGESRNDLPPVADQAKIRVVKYLGIGIGIDGYNRPGLLNSDRVVQCASDADADVERRRNDFTSQAD